MAVNSSAQQPDGRHHGFPRGVSGNPAGRKRGVPNKITREIRHMLMDALEAEGGVDYFRKVAQENPTVFCALIAKLLPRELKASLESDGGRPCPIRC